MILSCCAFLSPSYPTPSKNKKRGSSCLLICCCDHSIFSSTDQKSCHTEDGRSLQSSFQFRLLTPYPPRVCHFLALLLSSFYLLLFAPSFYIARGSNDPPRMLLVCRGNIKNFRSVSLYLHIKTKSYICKKIITKTLDKIINLCGTQSNKRNRHRK